MKKLAILGMFVLMLGATFASNPNYAVLELDINSNRPTVFEVNGRTYTSHNGHLTLNQLAPGGYTIRIFQQVKQHRYPGWVRSNLLYQGKVYLSRGMAMVGRLSRYGMEFMESPMMMCPPPEPFVYHMSPTAYQNLLRTMRSSSFDKTRLQIAQSAMRRNSLSTAQIAGLMRQLTFDSYRLELAKFGYAYCADPENYFNLTREFTFDSNARSLMNEIG